MRARMLVLSWVLLLGVLTSGCISIEQEIFLQADGSGDLVLHISLPDFPESMQSSPVGQPNTGEMMQKFKDEVMAKLPPTITLKDAKEQKRHGTQGFYAVFGFKSFKDVETLMANVMKESAKDAQTGANKPSEWGLQIQKQGNVTHVTQRFFADLSESKIETSGDVKVELKPAAPKTASRTTKSPANRRTGTAKSKNPGLVTNDAGEQAPPPGMPMDFGKDLEPLLYSAIKFRFVLHTPSPIREHNADIVLNGRTALWDCSLAAFVKEKKPIEMKVSF